eukprot:605086-Rhodomonas_salina.1
MPLPARDTVFAGQRVQTDWPETFRYVSEGQSLHIPDPLTGLKLPAEQPMHAFPSVPSYPMLQMQSVISSLPKSELVLAGQLRHTDPPVSFRYVPAP